MFRFQAALQNNLQNSAKMFYIVIGALILTEVAYGMNNPATADIGEQAIVILSPEDSTTTIGNTLFLSCVVFASDGAAVNVMWRHNGSTVTSDSPHFMIHPQVVTRKEGIILIRSILEICVTEVDIGGVYSCLAMGEEAPFNERAFQVSVQIPVDVRDSSDSSHNLVYGTSHEIYCEFIAYPPPLVTWLFDGKTADMAPFTTRQILTAGRIVILKSFLRINTTSILLSGKYTCIGENSHSRDYHDFHIKVQVSTEILVAPVSFEQGLTSSVILSCVAYGIPEPKVIWKYGDSAISDGLVTTHSAVLSGVSVIKSFLELCPENDGTKNGQYSCEMDNGIPSDTTSSQIVTFDLCFVDTMGLLVRPLSMEIVSGGTYYLPCMAYSNVEKQPLTITWTDSSGNVLKNSSNVLIFEEEVTEEGIYITRSILEISCASIENSMQYKCIASNGIGMSQESFDLTFTYGPIIKNQFPDERELKHGSTTTFSCIVSGIPTPNIAWFKDDQEIFITDETTRLEICNSNVLGFTELDDIAINSTLILYDLTNEDNGHYKCKAENKLGTVDLNHKLTVLDPVTFLHSSSSTRGVEQQGSWICIICWGILCIVPLIAVTVIYLTSSASSWPHEVCALLSSLFHIFFLVASLSTSNLVFLRLLTTKNKRLKLTTAALFCNWGLPLLCLVISLAPSTQNYMNINTCIPASWPLWIGILVPFVALHILSWVVLLLTPFLHRHMSTSSSSIQSSTWYRDTIAIGIGLFLFDLAWGVQLTTTFSSSASVYTTLQSIFVVSSASLGFLILVNFCFFHPEVIQRFFHVRDKVSSGDNPGQPRPNFLPSMTQSNDKELISIQVVAVPLPQGMQGEENEVVNKQADL